MVSAYANMVHHPGPLLDQMTQRILPKLETMDAGAHHENPIGSSPKQNCAKLINLVYTAKLPTS